MEIWQLRTFKCVAETQNFTKASEKLHLTQSAISHQIKALEDEFRVPLFVRLRRGVVLTDAGNIALEYAAKVIDLADEMRERVIGLESKLIGRVRVAAATQALVYLFAPLFERFMDTNEMVDLTFRTTTSTDQTVADILNGVADVGFASLAVFSPTLKVTELFKDELMLVVGRKHRLSGKTEVSVADIQQERWILFERGASIRYATDTFFKQVGVDPEMLLESNDTYFIKLMIERGLGVSLLPSWAVREEIEQGRLSQVKIKGHELRRSVSMVALKGAKTAPIRAFIDYIYENRAELQKAAIL